MAMIAITTSNSTSVKAIRERKTWPRDSSRKPEPLGWHEELVAIATRSASAPCGAFGRTAPSVAPSHRWDRLQKPCRWNETTTWGGFAAKGSWPGLSSASATPTCGARMITGPCEEIMSAPWVFREFTAAAARGWLRDTFAALAIRRGRLGPRSPEPVVRSRRDRIIRDAALSEPPASGGIAGSHKGRQAREPHRARFGHSREHHCLAVYADG